jgi:hypothetical protein
VLLHYFRTEGVGETEDDPLTDPRYDHSKIMLKVSTNGHTWKAIEPWRSVGLGGEYDKRVIWRRLGQYRNLHTRIDISAPFKRAIYALYPVIENDGR